MRNNADNQDVGESAERCIAQERLCEGPGGDRLSDKPFLRKELADDDTTAKLSLLIIKTDSDRLGGVLRLAGQVNEAYHAGTALRRVRRETGCRTSFFKNELGDDDTGAKLSLLMIKIESDPGLAVYEALRGRPGKVSFNWPVEVNPTRVPCGAPQGSLGVFVLSREALEI